MNKKPKKGETKGKREVEAVPWYLTKSVKAESKFNSESMEFIPGLPEEIGLECLTRLPYTAHRLASQVCRKWRHLLESREFYNQRKQLGYTHKIACFVQSLPVPILPDSLKTGTPTVYGISIFDPISCSWDRLEPIPKYLNGLPLFCQLCSSEGKLIVMGGWDPGSYDPVKDVFIYDFTTQTWSQGKDMPSKRSFFAAGAFDGRIYVAGGHDENKNALKTAWAYDIRRDEWHELPQMSQERDECEGVVIGNEFWVVSGYTTENQGLFEGSADVYDFLSGHWKRVEGAWEPGRCPRSCVGVGKDGRLVNWADSDSSVRVGSCGVKLRGQTLIAGSAYQGGPHEFIMIMTTDGGGKGKVVKITTDDGFSGVVQSGCCVEI